jgi:hypothetical protein
MNKTAVFVADPLHCALDDEVVDITKHGKVFDFLCCPIKYIRAYYHKLVECLAPSIVTLHKASKAGAGFAIVPAYLSAFFDVLPTANTSFQRIPHVENEKRKCYVKSINGTVIGGPGSVIESKGAWFSFHIVIRQGLVKTSSTYAGLQEDTPASIKLQFCSGMVGDVPFLTCTT